MNRASNAEILKQLHNMNQEFSESELNNIIHDQFFDDAVILDDEVVDAVLTRLLLLAGKAPDQNNLQKRRAELMTTIFKKVLIPKNEKSEMT